MSLAGETIGTQRLHGLGWRDAGLWATALVLVVGVQAAIGVVALASRPAPEPQGAPPPAILLDLAPAPVAPQVEDLAVPEGELAPDQVQLEPDPVPPEPVTEPPPAEPAVEPQSDPVIEPAPEPAPEPEPTPNPEPVPAPEPTPEPVRQPQPVPEPVVEPLPQVADPLPVPDLLPAEDPALVIPMAQPARASLARQREAHAQARAQQQRPDRQQQARPEPARERRAPAQPASQQAAPRSVQAQDAPRAAAPTPTATTRRTSTVSPQRWQSQVLSELNRAKRYPAEARRSRQQGVAQLRFAVDAAGRVSGAAIVRSSGSPSLDQATLEMVRRASPLPAPPSGLAQPTVTLVIPVEFSLR